MPPQEDDDDTEKKKKNIATTEVICEDGRSKDGHMEEVKIRSHEETTYVTSDDKTTKKSVSWNIDAIQKSLDNARLESNEYGTKDNTNGIKSEASSDEITIIDQQNQKQKEAVIYLQTDKERWEMTWPIWHLLPRDERKTIAQQYGYKSIGEFEEHMSFQQASSISPVPYPNELLYNGRTDQNDISTSNIVTKQESTTLNPNESNNNKSLEVAEQESDVEDNDEEILDQDDAKTERAAKLQDDTKTPTIEMKCPILTLPDELCNKIFDYLAVEMYGPLALVTPHWKGVTRTERVYKRLCERIYLHQSVRNTLRVQNFGNSYRRMLEIRPRVRMGGGVYVLKYSQIKRIQRDMWCEIPHGAILESVYYRYLYFQEDGRVLYALTCAPPHEVFPRLRRVCLNSSYNTSLIESSSASDPEHSNSQTRTGRKQNKKSANKVTSHTNNPSHGHHNGGASTSATANNTGNTSATIDSAIVWGTYSVQKYTVTVRAQQSWQYVQFELRIRPEYNALHGRFGYLTLEKHTSSQSGNWNIDCFNYDVPSEPFRYIRDRRL